MNFSDFKRLLGSDPLSRDADFLAARDSSPDFTRAAEEAEAFERQLARAMEVEIPSSLTDEIKAITTDPTLKVAGNRRAGWRPMAMAASVLVAVGVAGLVWNMNRGWDSVEEYVTEHFDHDGGKVLAMAESGRAYDLQAVLTGLGFEMTSEMAETVTYVKLCPTPAGKGLHLVLNTGQGPVSVLFMPETQISEGQDLFFNGMHARLLAMNGGSAAVIGSEEQQLGSIYAKVYAALTPISTNA
jgi:hypothetical protein